MLLFYKPHYLNNGLSANISVEIIKCSLGSKLSSNVKAYKKEKPQQKKNSPMRPSLHRLHLDFLSNRQWRLGLRKPWMTELFTEVPHQLSGVPAFSPSWSLVDSLCSFRGFILSSYQHDAQKQVST